MSLSIDVEQNSSEENRLAVREDSELTRIASMAIEKDIWHVWGRRDSTYHTSPVWDYCDRPITSSGHASRWKWLFCFRNSRYCAVWRQDFTKLIEFASHRLSVNQQCPSCQSRNLTWAQNMDYIAINHRRSHEEAKTRRLILLVICTTVRANTDCEKRVRSLPSDRIRL